MSKDAHLQHDLDKYLREAAVANEVAPLLEDLMRTPANIPPPPLDRLRAAVKEALSPKETTPAKTRHPVLQRFRDWLTGASRPLSPAEADALLDQLVSLISSASLEERPIAMRLGSRVLGEEEARYNLASSSPMLAEARDLLTDTLLRVFEEERRAQEMQRLIRDLSAQLADLERRREQLLVETRRLRERIEMAQDRLLKPGL